MDSWNLPAPPKELVDLIRTLAMALDFCKLKKWKHESWRGRFTLCRLHQFALFLPPDPVHLKTRYRWLTAFFLGLVFKQVTWLFVFSSPRPVLSLHVHLAVCCCFSFWFRSKALRNSSPPSPWYSASSWTCGSIPALLICSYSEATCWNLSGSHQQPDTKRNQNWWPSPHLCQCFWIQRARWRCHAWSKFMRSLPKFHTVLYVYEWYIHIYIYIYILYTYIYIYSVAVSVYSERRQAPYKRSC